MAKARIYEIARDLGLESKDVLAKAEELGLPVKTASSGLEASDSAVLKAALAPKATAPNAPVAKAATAEAPAPKAAAPKAVAPEKAEPAAAKPAPEADPEPALEPEAASGPAPVAEPEPKVVASDRGSVTVLVGITPAGFGEVIGRPGTEVVAALIQMGEMVGLSNPIPIEAFELLGDHFSVDVTVEGGDEAAEEVVSLIKPKRVFDDAESDLVSRPAVVTVMGHVDHGKTTLLDAIRRTSVVDDEAGGITQHIAAYQVEHEGAVTTFLDTPGHEAFTALRARGANVTDIVVLVVAADDGIMPQTQEAISHSKAADVPIIVAINKMDVPGADPHRVRAQLTEYGLVAEALGGDIPTVELSALSGEGVDTLLEVIDLVSQVEDLKGNPKPAASGTVVESQLDKGRGPVATMIVQRGTLKRGDALVAGAVSGRVRAMLDYNGEELKSAGPSTPVLVMGWSDVPTAGDAFDVTKNERIARQRAAATLEDMRQSELVVPTARERLTQLLEQLRTADEAELRLIVKTDAHGSLEAVRESTGKITREGGVISIVHGAVGGITENDVSLAEVTEALIFGFNVRPDAQARKAAEAKGIQIRTYNIIYELLNDIEALLVGRLAPDEVEAVLGSAEVREIFKVPRRGNIAGCYITEGTMTRGGRVRLLRAGVVIHDGVIGSLRRFKDDVREVQAGFECGISLEGYNDVKEGDVIEAYEVREVARS
ncbi:MAG: translation initiation factor IF-2 [Acidimicrobiia bacterium]|nr:translation initiation factor IF-2 [Acidimicrobiia bacterium]MDH5504330.1 translation initiation factor IF-2 [Acidimicrobiia bacterium]